MIAQVAVIIPTRNEARNIGECLRSIPLHVPVVVVDASSDETGRLIQQQRPLHTTIIYHPGYVTLARQIGAEATQAEWLLFTDADISFAPDYFDNLSAYLHLDAVYGPKQSLDEYTAYYRRFSRGQQWLHYLGIPAVSGSNLLVRRAVFQAVGGFDLRLTVNEDSEFGWRLKRQGYCIGFAPDLVVYARDQRRLARGRWHKTAHTLLRCSLLYTGLMPARWRSHDWGYWAARD